MQASFSMQNLKSIGKSLIFFIQNDYWAYLNNKKLQGALFSNIKIEQLSDAFQKA